VTRLKHPFAPVWAPDARVLILGSYPSVGSVNGGGYYGFVNGGSANDFWGLMGDTLGHPDMRDVWSGAWRYRYDTMKHHHLALWDVVASCTRDGASSDARLRDVRPNDIAGLITDRPDNGTDLERILFTGTRARDLFERLVMTREERTNHPDLWDDPHGRTVILWTLPSPSRAHTMPYARKLELYRAAFRGVLA